MLDGAARIKDLVDAVQASGQKAVAVTDHGVLHAAYYLWDECFKRSEKDSKGKPTGKNMPVKPIIGVEAYVTPGTSRFDNQRVLWGGPYGDSPEDRAKRKDDVSASGAYTHMTLWAEDNAGLQNLNWMQTRASCDRTIGKWARIDRDLLSQYSKGLLATTGCPSGAVQTYLRLGMYKEALREASELQDIFGKGNFWVELMDHGIAFERRTRNDLLKIAKEIGAPLLATNDLHYVKEEDAIAQDALLAINSGDTLENPNRFKFDGSGYFVRSTHEMFELFKELPDALTNTLEIVDRCNISYAPEQGRFMPHVPIPGGKSEDAYFGEQVKIGMQKRFPNGVPEDYQTQADYEIKTIVDMGFPSYFLVVSDFVRWAKENDIFVGPGRGSAAGSLVSYALEITDLDPIEHKLVFERFLNPDRISLPDIDIDFEEGGREKVIQYCAEKYGDDNVAQIITFAKIKSKQALRDAARILGYDYITGDLLSKAYPESPLKIKEVIEPARGQKEGEKSEDFEAYKSEYPKGADFRALYETDDDDYKYKKTADLATRIEGLTRGTGVHASGVLVSSDKIADVCPTQRRADDDAIITQFEAHGCEDLGFVKMDFLGLKNLNTNKTALKNIVRAGKEPVDLLKIPLDDKATFEMMGNAETLGVFQIDGEGMRSLLKRMRPTTFNDISATIALYRPGPMGVNAHNDYADRKNGRKKITPIHPEVDAALKDILSDTYGLVVFQEQIQFAARKLAGFSLGQADLLRRAMGKKSAEDLAAAKAEFEPGMLANGYSKAAVDAVWNVFQPFAEYAFNRAHTACYAFNAYTNAYLKANYPVEYMAALLTTNENNHAKLAVYLAECARMKIQVKVPDVNQSEVDFTPDGERIIFGLGAVRNVGEGVAEDIIKAREEHGKFISFNDFLEKVPESVCNKRKIESLIKAGAFDSLGYNRRQLYVIHAEAIDAILPVKRQRAIGQFDLFESLGMPEAEDQKGALEIKVPDLEEYDKRTKLDFEREMLGLYVSDHPLASLAASLNRRADFSLAALNDSDAMKDYKSAPGSRERKTAEVSGMITSIQKRVSKAGKPWASIVLEDLSGSATIAFFGKSFENNSGKMALEQIVQVKVRVEVEEGGTGRLSGSEVIPLNLSIDEQTPEITLKLRAGDLAPENVAKLKEIVAKYPGESQVILEVATGKSTKKHFTLPDSLRVDPSSAFYSEIKAFVSV
jgi:DNA polymerase-3 subunit alpha